MAATVRKAHLKDQKRKEKEEAKEAILLDGDENDENKQKTPQRRAIEFGAEREEDIEMNKKPAETETRKKTEHKTHLGRQRLHHSTGTV